MSKSKVVINSTPVISLSIIGKLDLLASLFEEVIVLRAVYREVVSRGNDKAGSRELSEAKWIKVENVLNEHTRQSIMLELDEGEADFQNMKKFLSYNIGGVVLFKMKITKKEYLKKAMIQLLDKYYDKFSEKHLIIYGEEEIKIY